MFLGNATNEYREVTFNVLCEFMLFHWLSLQTVELLPCGFFLFHFYWLILCENNFFTSLIAVATEIQSILKQIKDMFFGIILNKFHDSLWPYLVCQLIIFFFLVCFKKWHVQVTDNKSIYSYRWFTIWEWFLILDSLWKLLSDL